MTLVRVGHRIVNMDLVTDIVADDGGVVLFLAVLDPRAGGSPVRSRASRRPASSDLLVQKGRRCGNGSMATLQA